MGADPNIIGSGGCQCIFANPRSGIGRVADVRCGYIGGSHIAGGEVEVPSGLVAGTSSDIQFAGVGIPFGHGEGRRLAGGRSSNRNVIDVNTVSCIRSACRFGHHDSHIVLGSGGGDVKGKLLIAGADSGIVSIHNLGEGAGICRVRHSTHLEAAAGAVTLGLQCDTHAGQAGHLGQYSILVSDGCGTTATIRIEVQTIWCSIRRIAINIRIS